MVVLWTETLIKSDRTSWCKDNSTMIKKIMNATFLFLYFIYVVTFFFLNGIVFYLFRAKKVTFEGKRKFVLKRKRILLPWSYRRFDTNTSVLWGTQWWFEGRGAGRYRGMSSFLIEKKVRNCNQEYWNIRWKVYSVGVNIQNHYYWKTTHTRIAARRPLPHFSLDPPLVVGVTHRYVIRLLPTCPNTWWT